MSVIDTISTRRSVRSFTDQMVEKKTIEKLLNSSIQAPSSDNSQPWSFVILQEKTIIDELAISAKHHMIDILIENEMHPQRKHIGLLKNPNYNIFFNASTVVVIYANPMGAPHPKGDCCLAAQNFMLTAHSLGLGTCWIIFATEYLNLNHVKEKFNVPLSYQAVAPLLLGYPNGQNVPSIVSRNQPKVFYWK